MYADERELLAFRTFRSLSACRKEFFDTLKKDAALAASFFISDINQKKI